MTLPSDQPPQGSVPDPEGGAGPIAQVRFVPDYDAQSSYAALVLSECEPLLRRQLQWERYFKNQIRSSGKSAEGEVTMRVRANGVEYRSSTQESVFYWSMFERIVVHSRQVIFATDGWVRGSFEAFGVPFNAFSSGDAALEFYGAARSRHDASGFGELDRIKELTSKFALPCPSCRYSLERLAAPRCPECGLVLSITMLRFAQMLRR